MAHTQALETRKEFLARSVKELEDLVRTAGVLEVVLVVHVRPAPLHVGLPAPNAHCVPPPCPSMDLLCVQVARLSGQVQRERALGTSTEQRIAEMRSLVPYWRWEAKDRAERTTLGASFSSNAHAPSLSTSGIYGSSYLGSSGLR